MAGRLKVALEPNSGRLFMSRYRQSRSGAEADLVVHVRGRLRRGVDSVDAVGLPQAPVASRVTTPGPHDHTKSAGGTATTAPVDGRGTAVRSTLNSPAVSQDDFDRRVRNRTRASVVAEDPPHRRTERESSKTTHPRAGAVIAKLACPIFARPRERLRPFPERVSVLSAPRFHPHDSPEEPQFDTYLP